jgi:dolichyl-phosphate beta-glucosyltransferase
MDSPSAPSAPFGRLTIVLPAYNETARIGPALDELFDWLAVGDSSLPPEVTVLVVDDGSTDSTAALVLGRPEFAAPEAPALGAAPGGPGSSSRLTLLSVPHGGKGAAVRAGVLASDGDFVIFADADMATPPDQIPLLLEALRAADVALGSRIQPDGTDRRASQPPFRRLIGRVFHQLASLWVVGDVQDTQCGFKGFSAAAAQDLFGRQRITSIVFDVELIYLARRRGYRRAVIPVRWSDRRGSRMHPGPWLAAQVAWDLFRIPFLHRRVRPARPEPVAADPA